MPKDLSNLDAHTNDIIDSRRATKDARFRSLPEGVERVADVMCQVGERLAVLLSDQGFRFSKSQLKLSRRVGKLTQAIRLQSDSGNLSGVQVAASAHASVCSGDFKRWSAKFGTYESEIVWSRQLGYLAGGNSYYKWQFHDAARREGEIADLAAKIRELALPAFDAWSEPALIQQAVFRMTEKDRVDWLVELALWAGSQVAAEALVAGYLVSRPAELPTFLREVSLSLERGDISCQRHDVLGGLAYLAARHKLRYPVAAR